MPEPTNHDPEYLQMRCNEFEVQVNSLITVRDRQKVEIAGLKGEIERLTVSLAGISSTAFGCGMEEAEQCVNERQWAFTQTLADVLKLRKDHEELKAQLANLQKPVTDEEWKKIGYWERHGKNVEHWAKREGVDALIQSRLKDRQ